MAVSPTNHAAHTTSSANNLKISHSSSNSDRRSTASMIPSQSTTIPIPITALPITTAMPITIVHNSSKNNDDSNGSNISSFDVRIQKILLIIQSFVVLSFSKIKSTYRVIRNSYHMNKTKNKVPFRYYTISITSDHIIPICTTIVSFLVLIVFTVAARTKTNEFVVASSSNNVNSSNIRGLLSPQPYDHESNNNYDTIQQQRDQPAKKIKSSSRTLLGIVSYDMFGEQQYRTMYRQLFQTYNNNNSSSNKETNNKTIICSLYDFLLYNNDTDNDCELIYTFVIFQNLKNDTNNNTTTVNPPSKYSSDLQEQDVLLLQHQPQESRDRNAFTTTTTASMTSQWFQYATSSISFSTSVSLSDSSLFDYIGIMDTKTVLYLDNYFHLVQTSLSPYPYNTNVLYVPNMTIRSATATKSTATTPTATSQNINLAISNIDNDSNELYILSDNLAKGFVQYYSKYYRSPKRTTTIVTGSSNPNERSSCNAIMISYIESITSPSEQQPPPIIRYDDNQQPPPLSSMSSLRFIIIPKTSLFYTHISIRTHGAKQWKQRWHNEIQRIQTYVQRQYIQQDDEVSVMTTTNNNDKTKTTTTALMTAKQKDQTIKNVVEQNNYYSSYYTNDAVRNRNGSKGTTFLSGGGSNFSLKEYLNWPTNNQSDMFVIKWNSSGILDGTSYIRHDDWFKHDEMKHIQQIHHPLLVSSSSLHNDDNTTAAMTRNGRMMHKNIFAIVFNTDVMAEIDWTVRPPVPVLVYTLPNTIPVGSESNFYLIPPPYDRGFNQWCIWKAHYENAVQPFEKRYNTIIWRGALHSTVDPNRSVLVSMSMNQSAAVQRNTRRLNKKGRKTKRNKRHNAMNKKWLDASLSDDDFLSIEQMVRYKYQIDIGGQSGTSWGGIRWKMCTGSLVFKVDTWSRDWWHNLLIPYVHYIPVDYNLSNLYQQYLWAETHPDESYRIAQAGSKLCNDNVKLASVVHYWKSVIESLPIVVSSPSDNDDSGVNHYNNKILQEANELIDSNNKNRTR